MASNTSIFKKNIILVFDLFKFPLIYCIFLRIIFNKKRGFFPSFCLSFLDINISAGFLKLFQKSF
ncbi:hypothetical protein AMJ50_02435 [Parcubacteria bacterium DG_74_3]|nr:MAG: hypothetical protein AMJ50_02435 [Parcubacteria bacterium DG_74_3]